MQCNFKLGDWMLLTKSAFSPCFFVHSHVTFINELDIF